MMRFFFLCVIPSVSVLIMFLIATDLAGNTNTNNNKYIRLLTTAKLYGIIE
jgi:hypothetical protein